MAPGKALLIAWTNCSEPSLEQEYNQYYDATFIPAMLRYPTVRSATRFSASPDSLGPGDGAYLTLYDLDSDDPTETLRLLRVHMKSSGDDQLPGLAGVRAATFRRLASIGGAGQAEQRLFGNGEPEGVLVVFSDCGDPNAHEDFQNWYRDTHLPVMVATGAFRHASLWQATDLEAGEQRYMAIYEADRPIEAARARMRGAAQGWSDEERTHACLTNAKGIGFRRITKRVLSSS